VRERSEMVRERERREREKVTSGKVCARTCMRKGENGSEGEAERACRWVVLRKRE